MPKISAIIITYNEESCIGRCLDSIKDIADEIIVVDSYSTDRTEEICKKYNVRFISHEFEGYRDQKNFALKQATYPNILSLDADEALSDKLRESIIAIKDQDKWDYDGYKLNRRNYYCGTWIRFSEWYPDRQLRLFFSDHGEFGKLNLHEKFILSNGSRIGRLEGDLLHWAFMTKEEHTEKMAKYAVIGAKEFHKAGRKASIITPFIHSGWGFFRTYFLRGGFLDGANGLRICSTYAGTVFKKYKMLRSLNAKKPGKK